MADSAHLPYGEKPESYVERRALAIAGYFAERGAKAIAVACNTATAAAIGAVRARHPDLVVTGIEPAIKPAATLTRTGVIGVFATTGTLASPVSPRWRSARPGRACCCACPEWVAPGGKRPAGRRGRARRDEPCRRRHARGRRGRAGAGLHALPFLEPLLRERVGPDIAILEPAACARATRRGGSPTRRRSWPRPPGRRGACELLSSGDPDRLRAQALRLLQWDLPAGQLPAAAR